MEFDGLKIGGGAAPDGGKQKKDDESQKPASDAMDYVVNGAAVGKDILMKIKKIKVAEDDGVIYGVYDNRNEPLSVRINDFLVDRSKVTLKDKSYFFHMLAVMVDAGIPVISAVKSLAGRSDNPRFQRVLNTIAHNCEAGSNLADAMSRFEDVFDDSEIGIVKSGEATGRLHVMLFKVSHQLDKKHDLSMKLWGAAVYPIAVLAVLLIVSVAMLVWVFPSLLSLLDQGGITGDQLPLATRILIMIQGAVVNFWWLLLIIAFGLFGLFKMYISSDYGAVRWDYVKLKMPIIGTLLKRLSVLRFVSMLGLLIESGLPVIKSLNITGGAISNRIYKLKVQEVIDDVRRGGKISESLGDSEFIFPMEVVQMLRVGESSANLGKVSEKIADQYQREIDNTLKKLSSVFEPIMILVVGLFVALLALAIMAPIFNLSGSIGV